MDIAKIDENREAIFIDFSDFSADFMGKMSIFFRLF